MEDIGGIRKQGHQQRGLFINRTIGIVALLLSLMFSFSLAPAMAASKADKEPAAVEETKKEVNAKINVNTADVTELTEIPGIGPKTAEAIVAYRKENGQFKNLDDLIEVKGIGPKKLETIRPFLQSI
jgi:competence protein ComEA